jgi:uncharacterized membrane protein
MINILDTFYSHAVAINLPLHQMGSLYAIFLVMFMIITIIVGLYLVMLYAVIRHDKQLDHNQHLYGIWEKDKRYHDVIYDCYKNNVLDINTVRKK